MPHRCAAVLLCGDRPRRPPKCRERRIRVTNTPDFLTDDVAGLAISVPRLTATCAPASGRQGGLHSHHAGCYLVARSHERCCVNCIGLQ